MNFSGFLNLLLTIVNKMNLPNEILTLVAENLKGKDILAFEGVSRLFYLICKQSSLWRNKIYNEFHIINNKPSKKDYLENYFYVYFTVATVTANLGLENFQMIGKSYHNETFTVFYTDVSNTKEDAYISLKEKLNPKEKILKLRPFVGSNFSSQMFGINVEPFAYMLQNDVEFLLSERSQIATNICNCRNILAKTFGLDHCERCQKICWKRALGDNPDNIRHELNRSQMTYNLLGKKVKRKLNHVYLFISVFVMYNSYEDIHSRIPRRARLNFMNIFNTKEEIKNWMLHGGLEQTSRLIEDSGKNYTTKIYCFDPKDNNDYSYLNLTQNVMNTIRTDGVYKIEHFRRDGIFIYDKLEILKIPLKNDESFDFYDYEE